MAVTYDQSIVDKALDQHHLVAFCEVEGLQSATEQQLAELRKVVSGIRGLDPGSVRLAREPGAISFSFDPDANTAEGLLEKVRASLSDGMTVRLIRVMSERSALKR